MKVSILICSYAHDFPYVDFCLKSINKYASGFSEVVILIPDTDRKEFLEKFGGMLISQWNLTYKVKHVQVWPGKGMVHHEWCIFNTETYCPEADFVVHFDSDCIFTEPVTPATFIIDGKPLLHFEHFDTIGKRHAAVLNWKKGSDEALPFEAHYETMRHPALCYHIGLYPVARGLIEKKVGKSLEDYMKSMRNEYPQQLSEFVTLGNVAIECFKDKYWLVDLAKGSNPDYTSGLPVIQFWSFRAPDRLQDFWMWGKQVRRIPAEVCKEYGL